MFNYTLNEEESKSFVRYYKEDGDRINIYYHDKTSILSVENNDDAKTRLNNIQEQQVKNHNNSDYTLANALKNIFKFVKSAFPLQLIVVAGLGTVGLFFVGFKSYIILAKITSLVYSVPVLSLCSAFIRTSNLAKFESYIIYEFRLNQRIDKLNEEADKKNENSLNKVKTKKIKNLCINDINFMSYYKLKKMTNQIDKEERKARKIEELESTTRKRASDLGVESNKVLVKTRNSTK